MTPFVGSGAMRVSGYAASAHSALPGRAPLEGRMWAEVVVLPTPAVGQARGLSYYGA